MGYLRCKMGKTDSVSSVMSGVANQYFQVLDTCFALHCGLSRNNAATKLGIGPEKDALEHWTLPSDIIQATGRQRGAEGVKPTRMEAFIKICIMVRSFVYENLNVVAQKIK